MSTRRTKSASKRMLRFTAITTAATLVITTLAGCIPEANSGADDAAEFYKGAIPAAAPLTAFAGGTMPEPPVPPTDFSDQAAMEEYQRQAEEYMKQMEGFSGDLSSDTTQQFATEVYELAEHTRAGGEKAVAAWQSLLVASGIAVGGGDNAVEVSGMTGSGIPMPLEALRLQASLGTSGGRIYLTEFADMLDGAGFDVDVEELRESLSDGADYAFQTVFLALDPEGNTFIQQYYGDIRLRPSDEITLSAAQVGLALRRLAAELAIASEDVEPAASGSPAPPGIVTVASAAAPQALGAAADLCAVDREWWDDQVRKESGSLRDQAFDWAMKNFNPGLGKGFSGLRSGANAINAIADFLTKFFLLGSEFSIDSDPLVRTKDRSPGQRQNLAVTLSFRQSDFQDAKECVARLYEHLGVSADAARGPAKGVDVNLKLTGSRLQYARGATGTGAYRQKADDSGKVVFAVEGKQQPNRLPEGAEPEEVTSGVEVSANLKGSDLYSDLRDAANDARGGIIAMLLGALERMKLLTFTWDVPVRDWTLEAEFDMTLTGVVSAHSASNYTVPGLYDCSDYSTSNSTSAVGQMNGKPHRVDVKFLSGKDDGEALTMLLIKTKGMSIDDLKMHSNGTEVAYAQFDYGITKLANEPGVDPLPPHAILAGSGCGDGNGEGSNPQPDCGERTFQGLFTVNLLGEFLYITVDDIIGNAWSRCGGSLQPSISGVPSPPSTLDNCQGDDIGGGAIPNLDTVFNPSNKFEISGELSCSRDGEGTLDRFTFDWTLEFCRIVEGKRAC